MPPATWRLFQRPFQPSFSETDKLRGKFFLARGHHITYNPQNEMFAAFETNRSLLKNETYPKIKKFSPGFAGV